MIDDMPMPLRRYTRESVRAYLQAINNHHNGQLYDLVIAEVERGMIKEVLLWCNGNQTPAGSLAYNSRLSSPCFP